MQLVLFRRRAKLKRQVHCEVAPGLLRGTFVVLIAAVSLSPLLPAIIFVTEFQKTHVRKRRVV
jgi:hypothetical protein